MRRSLLPLLFCAFSAIGLFSCGGGDSGGSEAAPTGGDADAAFDVDLDATGEQSEADDTGDGASEAETETAFAIRFFFPPTTAVGGNFDVGFEAEGGKPPYSQWKVVLGELPAGTALVAASGRWTGAPTTEGLYQFVVSVTDSTGAAAEELFGVRIGDPAAEGPMASRARRYLEVYENRHLWGGLSFNAMQPDAPDGNYKLSTCGDCSFQSGQCTAAMAYRQAVEKSEASLATIKEQIAGWRRFMKVTGEPGLTGRCYAKKDVPMEDGSWQTFWPEDPTTHNFRGEGEYADYYWHGDASIDQVTGAVLGVSTAFDLVDDEEVKRNARDFMTELVDRIWSNDMRIVDKDGEMTTYGNVNPRDWQGAGICTGLEAACMLAWVKAAGHMSGEPRFAEYFDKLMHDPAPDDPRIACKAAMLDILRDYMWVYSGYSTKHYNVYMAFENFYILQRLEEDPQLFASFRDIFRDTLWLNLDDNTPNRCGVMEHNPVKTAWYLYSTGEKDARSLYHALWQTAVFPEPPLRDRLVVNSTNPDIEKNPDQPGEAMYPLPPYLRTPDMVIWHRNPFSLDGGSDSGEERTGCDYLLPYWMGRYYGYVSGEW